MQLVCAVCNADHTYFDVYNGASAEYDLLKFDMVIVISDLTKTHKSHADNDVVNTHVDAVVFAFNKFSYTKLFMKMPTMITHVPRTQCMQLSTSDIASRECKALRYSV
ncbi:hypothetical protein DPMN_118473 [Dreissena polymorpha]|uniref:Uncharacterized protein n=1 Tax=Dreissena polymorpha TaxID=45954 RepID=A0A9D4JQ99_DREPO|nr:hypothetical protein DPMN_118473 [Dreissena polymorpha]